MIASPFGYRIVVDDAWRAELVLHRDRHVCTASWEHDDGHRSPCKKKAVDVAWLPRDIDARDLRAWAATCEKHLDSTTHQPRTGSVRAH